MRRCGGAGRASRTFAMPTTRLASFTIIYGFTIAAERSVGSALTRSRESPSATEAHSIVLRVRGDYHRMTSTLPIQECHIEAIELPRRKSDGLFLNPKQAHELRENTVTQLVEPLDMLWGFQLNALGIDLAAESDDFLPILTHFKPAMNHRLIDFQVKLKPINIRTIPKSLVGA